MKRIKERGRDKDVKKEIFLKALHVGRMAVNPETISWLSPDSRHKQIASKHRQIGNSCFAAYPTHITVTSHLSFLAA
jgi:hypothetical protein